jgi:hypothetical protein
MKRMQIRHYSLERHIKQANIRKDHVAVSEIMGTILLLSISITLLTVFYIVVLHNATNPTNTFIPSVNIVGEIQGKNVILEHRGGLSVNSNATVTVTIAGTSYHFTVKDYLNDTNHNGKWDIGERVVYQPAGYTSLLNLEISLVVVDPSINTVLMHGLIQEGEKGDVPYVQTMSPINVMPHSASLKLYYNFLDASYLPGKVWFIWKNAANSSWTTTVSTNIVAGLTGFAQVNLTGLLNNQAYLCQAWIQYKVGGSFINKSGSVQLFSTANDTMGMWRFEEASGPTVFDTSGQTPSNDGTLKPNTTSGPQRMTATLKNSLRCLSFDGIDDTVEIPSSPTLNMTNEITMEAWINRSQHCDGLIGVPVSLALSQFKSFYEYGCINPNIIHINGGIYAIVSNNETAPNPGYLITVNISSNGAIVSNDTTSIVDILRFSTSCKTAKIIYISGSIGIYGIVYINVSAGNKLFLTTVNISSNGIINKAIISSRQLTAFLSGFPDIIRISGSTNGYAIVYGVNASLFGRMLSVNVSNTGVISPVNKLFIFYNESMQETIMIEPEIIQLQGSADNYVIVYNCIGDDGGIRTVKITATGVITNISAEMEFDEDDGGQPEIIHVSGNYYAIAYCGPASTAPGWRPTMVIRTVRIFANGIITPKGGNPKVTKIYDTIFLENLPGSGIRSPRVLAIDPTNRIFAVTYEIDVGGGVMYGRMKTLQLDATGHLVQMIDALTFESYYASMPDFINISGNVYGIVYQSDVSDGILKTVQINLDGSIPNKPVINTTELGAFNCYEQDALLTSDGKYVASVFRTIDRSLMVKTVKVNSTQKSIATTFSNTFTIEPGNVSSKKPNNASYMPAIIPINGNVYAIVYCQYLDVPTNVRRGKIITITIDGNGRITPIMNRTFDNTNCTNTPMRIIPVNKTNNIYAIVYQLKNNTGRVKTVKITNAGTIMNFPGSYCFEIGICREPSIVCVNKTVYAIAYRDNNNYGRLRTIRILSDGTIPLKVNDTFQFETTSCFHPRIIKENGNIFAIVYSRTNTIGFVITLKILINGSIVKPILDRLQFESANGNQPDIVPVKERIYALVYQSSANLLGRISTVRLGENGDLPNSVDSTSFINPSSGSCVVSGYDIRLIPFTNTSTARYYIALEGGRNMDIFMSVIRINITGATRNVMSKQGAYAIQANGTNVFANITDTTGQVHILSAPLHNGWNCIACTYDSSTMNLYLNATMVNTTAISGKAVKKTPSKLIFGEYNAMYDEFGVFASAIAASRITSYYNYFRTS